VKTCNAVLKQEGHSIAGWDFPAAFCVTMASLHAHMLLLRQSKKLTWSWPAMFWQTYGVCVVWSVMAGKPVVIGSDA